jgi:hypothetical protein
VPNKWWEAKVLPLKVRTPCKCKGGFECGGDWRNHFPVVVPDGYVQQWWDEQVPDAAVSFYIATESDHHVGCHDESLYMVMLMFISTAEITANDNIMLIRQVNSGGVITSDVVMSAVTTESAIQIKVMQERGGVGTTLFQTDNKKEDYKPEVFKTIASALGIDMPVCKNHPECEWKISTNPWQSDMYLRGFDGVPAELMYHRDCMPTEVMRDIASAPAQGENTRTSTTHTSAPHKHTLTHVQANTLLSAHSHTLLQMSSTRSNPRRSMSSWPASNSSTYSTRW